MVAEDLLAPGGGGGGGGAPFLRLYPCFATGG